MSVESGVNEDRHNMQLKESSMGFINLQEGHKKPDIFSQFGSLITNVYGILPELSRAYFAIN